MFKEDETQYCKNCYELQEQLDQLKAENELYKQAHKTEQDRRRKFEQVLDEIKEVAWVNAVNTCWSSLHLCDKCDEKEECGLQSPFAKLKQILEKILEVEDEHNG